LKQISFEHHFDDSQLVIAVDVGDKNDSGFQKHLIHFVLGAKMVEDLPIAAFGAVHKYSPFVVRTKVVNCACSSVIAWLHA
jgi:hypothetical protein